MGKDDDSCHDHDNGDKSAEFSLAIDSDDLDSCSLSERMRQIHEDDCQPGQDEVQLIDNVSWDNSSSEQSSDYSNQKQDMF